MALDFAHTHPARIHRDDLLVETVEALLTLSDDLGLEATGAIARDLELELAVLARDGLLRGAVSGVAGVAPLGRMLLVAKMVCELGVHRALDERLGQLLEQAVLTE